MNKIKLSLFTVTLLLLLSFTLTSSVFADTFAIDTDGSYQEELLEAVILPDSADIQDIPEPGIMLFSKNGVSIRGKFTRDTNKKGTASIQITSVTRAQLLTCKMTLQRKTPNGSYVNTGVETPTVTGGNRYSLSHKATFKITSKNIYRVKVTAKSKVNGVTSTQVGYRTLVNK